MKMKRALSALLALLTLLSALQLNVFAEEFGAPPEDPVVAEEQSSGEAEISSEEETASEVDPSLDEEVPSENDAEDEAPADAETEVSPEEEPEALCGDGVCWSYDAAEHELTLSFTGTGTGKTADWKKDDSTLPWYGLLPEIEKLTVEEGVTALGDYAFSGAKKLKEISLPATLTSLGTDEDGTVNVFFGSSSPEKITVAPGNPVYAAADGVLYDAALTAPVWPLAEEDVTPVEEDEAPAEEPSAPDSSEDTGAEEDAGSEEIDSEPAADAAAVGVPGIGAYNASGGITVCWSSVSGASSYSLIWRVSNGSWSTVSVSGTSYTLTGLTGGTRYDFRVRACVSGVWGDYSALIRVAYLAAPEGLSVSCGSGSAALTWNAVSGAEKYRVFYKTSGGTWTTVTDCTSASCTVSGLTAGTSYSFCVRAYDSGYRVWSTYSSSVSGTCPALTAPELDVYSSTTGITLEWNAVSGASAYLIQSSADGGAWSAVTTVTATNYTASDCSPGSVYKFRVCAVTGSGTSGPWSNEGSGTWLAPSEITSLTPTNLGVIIAYSKVSGARGYVIQRSTDGTNWTLIAGLPDTAFTDTTATSAGTYWYRVASKSDYTTSAYGTAKSVTIGTTSTTVTLESPTISSWQSTAFGVVLSYTSVSGAQDYLIERSTDGSTWSTLTTTTSTTYTDTTAANGSTYWYRVTARAGTRSACSAAKSVTYSYNAVSGYADYTGINYYDQTTNPLRLAVLDYAKKMCTVMWTSPCDMVTWCNSDGTYCGATATDGTVSSYFMAGKTYVGVPYSQAHTITSAEQWLSIVPTLTADNSSTNNQVVSRPYPFTKYGTDCSYFVYTCINYGKTLKGCSSALGYVTTSGSWSSYYTQVSYASAQPGDAFVKSGHVRLFAGRTADGGYAFFESTAGSRVSNCVYSVYSESSLSSGGYKAWAFNGYQYYN